MHLFKDVSRRRLCHLQPHGLEGHVRLSPLQPVGRGKEHAEVCPGVLYGPGLEVALSTSVRIPLARTRRKRRKAAASSLSHRIFPGSIKMYETGKNVELK